MPTTTAYNPAATGADAPLAAAYLPAAAAPHDPPAAAGYDSAGYDSGTIGIGDKAAFAPPADDTFGSGSAGDYYSGLAAGPADAGPPAAVGTGRPAGHASPAVSTSSSRGRAGAHAARHGKPSRRRRGSGAGRYAADQDTAQAAEDDHSALRETLSPDPRAPWERGDAS